MKSQNETSPLSKSPRKYSSKQMGRALNKVKERKNARQRTKDGERSYSKQQFPSSSLVTSLRSEDIPFPKKRASPTNAGTLRAHFLAIRPNVRFATWIGRRKDLSEGRSPISPRLAKYTDHSTSTSTSKTDSARQTKSRNANESIVPSTKSSKNDGVSSASKSITAMISVRDDGGKSEKIVGGNNSDNPLVNGVPFWVIKTGNEDEITDEDLPVDMDILERVVNGDVTMAERPYQKVSFDPFGPMQSFKVADPLFQRDTHLITATISSVLYSQPENEDVIARSPTKRLVQWGGKVKVMTYDPNERGTFEGPASEDLKNIVRDKINSK